jgi:RNA polymerase sigma-70 factor (ECF subfamily)
MGMNRSDPPRGRLTFGRFSRKPAPTDWESVYREIYPDILRFLRGMLLDDERAKDLAQEAFVRVLGMNAENPRGLVFRTAANLARDEARMVVRRKRHLALLRVEEDVRAERTRSPQKEVEAREQSERLRRALEQLSHRDREVLLLWNAGLDYEEIAEQTGLARGAIGTTVARAKKKLVDAHHALGDIDAAHG